MSVKGLVHPKLTKTFVLLNTKEDIWKNVLIKQISFPINGSLNILPNIFLCVQQNK